MAKSDDHSDIIDKIDQLSSTINQSNIQAGIVGTNLQNLTQSVQEMKETLKKWDAGGCPFGRENRAMLENTTCAVFKEIKPDLEKIKSDKKQQAVLGASSGAASGALISIISNVLTGLFK